jgi:predicted GNAT superfamily acetyltransferase
MADAMDEQDQYRIRLLTSIEEYKPLEELQMQFMNMAPRYVFPVRNFTTAVKQGGTVLCLFDSADKPRGFIFHFPGFYRGELIGWSCRLVVDPQLRNREIELRLKEAQQQAAIEAGLKTLCWTFDPLNTVAALRNFSLRGTTSSKYLVNFSEQATILSGAVEEVDCLLVEWELSDEPVTERTTALPADTPVVMDRDPEDPGMPVQPDISIKADTVAIPVPADMTNLDKKHKQTWRRATRRAFCHYMNHGYCVTGFIDNLPDTDNLSAYILYVTTGGFGDKR